MHSPTYRASSLSRKLCHRAYCGLSKSALRSLRLGSEEALLGAEELG